MKRTIRNLAHRLARTAAWTCTNCGCLNSDSDLSCGYC